MSPKEKFLSSALKLFNEKWFENTSTASISNDAWYSTGAMFFHFKTKNELLDELYTSIKKKSASYITNNLDDDLRPDDKIRKILELWFDYYLSNYEEFVFMKSFTESYHIIRINKDEIQNELNSFYDILNQWKSQELFINEDSHFLHTWITGMLYYYVEYVNNNKNISVQKCLDIIMRVILL